MSLLAHSATRPCSYDTFMQHDVQELNRVLVDKLEEKMKVHCCAVLLLASYRDEPPRTESFYSV